MSPESFKYLLNLVGPRIHKQDTRFRKAISASERLCLTIHYLAYGNSQQSISFSYRIGKSTVSKIIHETCVALWDSLKNTYVRSPSSVDDWKKISDEFKKTWNLPHCVGAIDGKHVSIKSPLKSGSLYYNYKGYFSMVLMAICDARYCFSLVDIGSYGSNNDSGIFRNSIMGKKFLAGEMNLPTPEPLENSPVTADVPYFLVGDEAFPLQPWLMRPFSGQGLPEEMRIFNYRLSRARRVIENSFGILAARWRIFLRPIQTNVETTQVTIQAAIALHNFLRQTNSATYCPTGFVDSYDDSGAFKAGEWRSIVLSDGSIGSLAPLHGVRGSRPTVAAVHVRDDLTRHVNSLQGSVSWQWDYVRSRGEIIQ